jgi:hypothetical protein
VVLLAQLLLALPAAAAPHAVLIRAVSGRETFERRLDVDPNVRAELTGIVAGRNMKAGVLLQPKRGGFMARYQLELSSAGRSFEVQSAVELDSGGAARTFDCGGWTVDVFLDAETAPPAPPEWNPEGPNRRVTASANGRDCRVTVPVGEHFNAEELPFRFDGVISQSAGHLAFLQYHVASPPLDARGAGNFTLGRRTPARGGKPVFLIEGAPVRARRVRAPPPVGAQPEEAPVRDGAPALLR